MKAHLHLALALGLCITGLHAQSEIETEAPEKELLEWEQNFLNLSEENRKDFFTHVNKSRELFNQKRVFECIEELNEAKEIFGDSPDIENLLGACQVEFRAFDRAMEHFSRANELQPGSTSILFNIAEVLFVTKQWEKTEAALTEILEMANAEDSEVEQLSMKRLIEFKLMLTKIKLGKLEEAREMAALYDHLDDSPYCYYAEAALAYQEGDELTAEKAMARAARVFRNPADTAPWQDTMMEFGYVKSLFGGDIPDEE